MTDKCKNLHIQAVAIEFSRRREQESSASRTFVKLIVLDYRRTIQSRRESEKILSALCEVVCEQSRGLKISVVRRMVNSCVRRILNRQLFL